MTDLIIHKTQNGFVIAKLQDKSSLTLTTEGRPTQWVAQDVDDVIRIVSAYFTEPTIKEPTPPAEEPFDYDNYYAPLKPEPDDEIPF